MGTFIVSPQITTDFIVTGDPGWVASWQSAYNEASLGNLETGQASVLFNRGTISLDGGPEIGISSLPSGFHILTAFLDHGISGFQGEPPPNPATISAISTSLGISVVCDVSTPTPIADESISSPTIAGIIGLNDLSISADSNGAAFLGAGFWTGGQVKIYGTYNILSYTINWNYNDADPGTFTVKRDGIIVGTVPFVAGQINYSFSEPLAEGEYVYTIEANNLLITIIVNIDNLGNATYTPSTTGTYIADSIYAVGYYGMDFGGSASIIYILKPSGIYTLTANKRHDTLYERLGAITTIDVAIPEPFIKTAYMSDEDIG